MFRNRKRSVSTKYLGWCRPVRGPSGGGGVGTLVVGATVLGASVEVGSGVGDAVVVGNLTVVATSKVGAPVGAGDVGATGVRSYDVRAVR